MRKLIAKLLTLFLCIFTVNISALALSPIVITPGITTITNSLITQNITAITPVVSSIKFSVTPLDDYVINVSTPSVKIPIGNLLLNLDGTEYPLTKNVPLMLIQGNYPLDVSLTKNFAFLLRNLGSLPNGTYTTTLQFKTETGEGVLDGLLGQIVTLNYTFQFTVNQTLNIDTTTLVPTINLDESTIFVPASITNNVVDTRLNIDSNCNWRVYLNTNTIGTLKRDYYYQVIGKGGNVSEYDSGKVKIESNQQYELARGSTTGTAAIPVVAVPTYITIRYSYTNNETNYMPEGTYTNPVQLSITPSS